jgi:hypothetical protein
MELNLHAYGLLQLVERRVNFALIYAPVLVLVVKTFYEP